MCKPTILNAHHIHKRECISDAIYGQIWKGHRTTDQTDVAIKELSLVHVQQHVASDKFGNVPVFENPATEEQIYLGLKAKGGHPSILPILDAFEDKEHRYMVFPYCAQGDALSFVMNEGPVEETQALDILSQVLNALTFLEQVLGVCHRDVSLENILLNAQRRVQLCDFGLACPSSAKQVDVVGKDFYRAPEINALLHSDSNHTSYDPKSADVWSLGILLFILVTGAPLVQVAEPSDVSFQYYQTHGLKKFLQARDISSVPKAVQNLLVRMLQIDPTKRPSLLALMEALDHHRDKRSKHLPRLRTSQKLFRKLSRHLLKVR